MARTVAIPPRGPGIFGPSVMSILLNLHPERAVLATLDFALTAEDRSFRSAELRANIDRMRQPKGRHKEHPLATVVAEGGVPGGLVEDLPNGRALKRVEKRMARALFVS